jgi:hypothetical protein
MAGLSVWVAPLALADKDNTKPNPWASMDSRLPATAACLTERLARHTVNHIHPPLTVVAIIVVSSNAFHLRVRRAFHFCASSRETLQDDTREQSSSSR